MFALVVAGAFAHSVSQPSEIDAAMTAYAQAQIEQHHEPMPAPDLGILGWRAWAQPTCSSGR